MEGCVVDRLITVYHGSKQIVEVPTFGLGRKNNDFGLGFYCTESLDLAKEWAVSSLSDGFANRYTLDTEYLNILNLNSPDYTILNWMAVLVAHRLFSIKTPVARRAKQYLIDRFGVNVNAYDLITGYRADDSYFDYAEAFLNNTITVEQLSHAMQLGKLGEQIARSQRSNMRVLKSRKKAGTMFFANPEMTKQIKPIWTSLRKEPTVCLSRTSSEEAFPMTTRAYQEIYLSKAQAALGDAFDYAINTCHIPGSDFVKLFTASSVSKRMENGEPALLAGKSGIEIAADVLLETTGKHPETELQEHLGRSREYWIGWAVCYYQWFSARSYSDIFNVLSYEDLANMYYTLHEADITKFVDIADEKIRAHFKDTNLKRIRNAYGCTQAELAKRSGVTLRSIQMYEQRNKDINKASADALYRISKVLGCSMESLLEK